MSNYQFEESTNLDSFLNPPTSARPVEEFKHKVFQETRPILRRRRWLRRSMWLGAFFVCYLAGWSSARFAASADRDASSSVATSDAPKSEVEAPSETLSREKPVVSSLALEWQAVDHPDNRPELYKEAGDQYLKETDISSAVRCYRGAMATAAEKDLAISVDDNWLLMALKEAREKEKNHAKTGG